MNWADARVLVTGADGFIGSHLTEALAQSGAQVTALAQYNSFDSAGWLDDLSNARVKVVRGDIRDTTFVRDLVAGQDVIFHLAALIAIPFSYHSPASYVATNIQGTLNVLDAALASGVRRIVHTSTSEVYGTARYTPINESHPLLGQSPYAASKIGADMMAISFHRSFRLPVVILRPFNTFGPRQSERAVISTIIRQALDPRCAGIRLGDLTPKRDFNFVLDTARAFMAAADIPEAGLGEVYNAGSGRMVSIGEVLEVVQSLTGNAKPVMVEDERKRPPESEVMALMADSTRLNSATGWAPTVSLEEGLEQTISWWAGRIERIRATAAYMI